MSHFVSSSVSYYCCDFIITEVEHLGSLFLFFLFTPLYGLYPWYADLSYLYDSMDARRILSSKYKGDKGYLKFYKDMGAGIYFYAPFLWETTYTGGISYNEIIKSGIKACTYITPIGELKSVQKYLPETFTWAYTEHFVKDINDLRTMEYIFKNTVYTENFEEFKHIDKLWGGDGIPAALAPISAAPLQKLLARWAGVEGTINIYMDNMDEFEKIISKMGNTEDKVFEILCKSDADYIEFPENLSSEITGKSFFKLYNMPYYKKRIKQLHDAGKYVGIHIDGTLKACLPLLNECGFDVAEAVTPYPVGDVKIEDLRNLAGSGIVIWGGLPGAMFSPKYKEEDFDEHIKKLIRTFPPGSGFVLGVADQVPPDGLVSRVKKVRKAVENWY